MIFSELIADMRPIKKADTVVINFDGVSHKVSGYYRCGGTIYIETGPLEEIDESDISGDDFV